MSNAVSEAIAGTVFINGEFIAGDGSEFQSLCPVDEHVVWDGCSSGRAQIDAAFDAARGAFGAWWDAGADKRIEIVSRCADLIKENADELAWL
ncbi:MAG: aldehyde dehydrogenase family protein, partial [Planctomycetota bacterium]